MNKLNTINTYKDETSHVKSSHTRMINFGELHMTKKKKINHMKRTFLYILLSLVLFNACKIDSEFLATDHDIIGDLKTVNTVNIQKLINKVSERGGGRIIFPKGDYVSGSLILKSNVELHIEEGATLYGSIDPRDYWKIDVEGMPVSPKTDDNSKLALILSHDTHNISITGKGTIDGRGGVLVHVMDSLHKIGEYEIKEYDHGNKRIRETERPKILMFMESDHVTVSGITIKNSAVWVQTYELCTNVRIDGITVESRAFWNNDGMDISDCRNVRITNCNVNAADDGICLKSYYPGHCNDSIYIANCTVRSSASAIKFGTASIGGFKNVTIENIKVFDTFRSMIAIESVDGGDIENIHVSNMVGKNTGNALFVRLGHRSGDKPGYVKNITIKDLTCEVPYGRPDEGYAFEGPMPREPHNQYPAPITGIPDHYIENVTLENIEITYPGKSSKDIAYIDLNKLDDVPERISKYPEYSQFGELPSWGFYARHVKGLSMKNITLKLEDKDFRPPFVFDDVFNLEMSGINAPQDNNNIVIRGVEGIQLDDELSDNIVRITSKCKKVQDENQEYRFKDKIEVTLSSKTKTAKIYYTLNGTTPSKKSKLYEKPIEITDNTHLKAIAIAEGYYSSDVYSKRYSKTVLNDLPKGFPKISLEEKPNKYGDPNGSQLIDEVFGTTDFRDKKWTGLNEKDLVVEFDLGQPVDISGVQVSTLTATQKWRFPPKSITIYAKEGSGNYKKLKTQKYHSVSKHHTELNFHNVKFSSYKAQHVKIVIKNYGTLPKWHVGAGKLPWIFVDEININ